MFSSELRMKKMLGCWFGLKGGGGVPSTFLRAIICWLRIKVDVRSEVGKRNLCRTLGYKVVLDRNLGSWFR